MIRRITFEVIISSLLASLRKLKGLILKLLDRMCFTYTSMDFFSTFVIKHTYVTLGGHKKKLLYIQQNIFEFGNKADILLAYFTLPEYIQLCNDNFCLGG